MPIPPDDSRIRSLLVLRHLHDGDVIDWPVPDDHPQRDLLTSMEAQGLITRWDRTWPLHDRFRLTDRGLAEIQAHYDPGRAESVRRELESRRPDERPAALRAMGLDPVIWPTLHDPSTHWRLWGPDPGTFHRHVWGSLGAGEAAATLLPAVAVGLAAREVLEEMDLDAEARAARRRARPEEETEDIS